MNVAKTVEQAVAKLNLGLKILNRRADGYHNILSVFQAIDLCDVLEFDTAAHGTTEIVCDTPGIPTGPENLVYRAVDAVRSATGATHGLHIRLIKKIPVGAGLGGGSSDAAATLRALNRMWGLCFSNAELHDLAAGLGSDVPFFLQGGTALVTGRGEQIRPMFWDGDFHYVLVYPEFEVSSAWAYQNVKIGLTGASIYISFLNSMSESGKIRSGKLIECLENDFLPLLETTYPEVGQILDEFSAAGALGCSLSGSGSTLFGVFEQEKRAVETGVVLQSRGYRVFHCRAASD